MNTFDLPMVFWTAPTMANVVVTTKQLREIQLRHGGQVFAQGKVWEIKRQSLGGGTYKVTLKEKVYS